MGLGDCRESRSAGSPDSKANHWNVERDSFVYHQQQQRKDFQPTQVDNTRSRPCAELGWKMLKTKLLTLAVFLASMPTASAAQPEAPIIEEWTVPWENSRPRDPYVDSAGLVWFVGQRSHYIASLNPENGSFRQLVLDPGTGPHNLIIDGDHTIWYAGNLRMHIGRMDTATGAIHKVAMPDETARDPHTLVFDDAGDIWFTVQGGNFVGKLSVANEQVDLFPVPTPRARPYGINIAGDGTVWVAEFGTNKLLKIDPATYELTEIELPETASRPRRLEVTSDGMIWYVDYAEGQLGRLNPESGEITQWPMPGGKVSRPYGMEVDADNRLWIVETGPTPNQFVGFDPRSESFFGRTPIPSGGGSVRHMHYDAATNVIWFGTDTNTIGRATLPGVSDGK